MLNNITEKTRRFHKLTVFILLLWTFAVAASFFYSFDKARSQAMEQARITVISSINKDISFRQWAAKHGGVFVPITSTQKPVPWLPHDITSDAITADGRKLTLLNPSSMLRQVIEQHADSFGLQGRITGLKYLNPANAPDQWEQEQLEKFEHKTAEEAWQIADINGIAHLRYLRVLKMGAGCVKCHGVLGYKTGDIRGGIGLNLPLADYYSQISDTRQTLGLSHFAIWILGIIGIIWAGRQTELKNQQRLQALHALQENENALNQAQAVARIGSWQLDAGRNRTCWSDEACRIFAVEGKREMSYAEYKTLVHPEDIAGLDAAWQQANSGNGYEVTHRILVNDEVKWVREIAKPELDHNGNIVKAVGTVQDITSQKLHEETLRLYANIFRYSGEAILITDKDRLIIATNPAFNKLTGYALDDLIGKTPKVLASGRTSLDTYRNMWATLEVKNYWQGELYNYRKDGTDCPVWASVSVVRDSDGETINYIGSYSDLSERKKAAERIYHLAHHDQLTGLFNRQNLENRLEQAITMAKRDNETVAVIFIDLDRFKTINDIMGHNVGDKLLIEVARRLILCVQESDIVARSGGDEFIVVLTGISAAMGVTPIAQTILSALCMPFTVNGKDLRITPSIGISFFPDDSDNAPDLMMYSETAMYHAKEQGRNNIQFFNADMNKTASEKLVLEQELRLAIENKQLELYYQPKVHTADGKLYGFEALLRWHHPELGIVSPMKFIPIAEESGIIETIGVWVLDEACRQIVAWREAGTDNLTMAVNLSAYQLRSPDLPAQVQHCMKYHGIRENELELEVTESAAMDDPEQAILQLLKLRELGVTLAVDDFGTGYSSLAYLKLLPIQSIKLDRTFVRDIETDANDAAICTATIALAHSLGLKVVAEGVEYESQRDFLARHKCDYLQGYLFGKPQPAQYWTDFWSKESSRS
ncbi:MAG: EAL domain-containing protein [Trichlorobacter sp.]|nr:EAL domain-containing protein [Trichlorobacter sp.]